MRRAEEATDVCLSLLQMVRRYLRAENAVIDIKLNIFYAVLHVTSSANSFQLCVPLGDCHTEFKLFIPGNNANAICCV